MNRLGSAAIAAAALAAGTMIAMPAWAAASCPNPRQMDGFKTCADVEKAKQEGSVVFYTTDPESNAAQFMGEFQKMFPEIKGTYLRLQAGALYAKITSERRAQSYLADVMSISDMTFVLDFQKRGGYASYVSPEYASVKSEYKSKPEGLWAWGTLIVAGIAYNPNLVPAAEAPKTWKDLLDPKWKGSINVKVSNSGLQHETWYLLRQILGEDYWKKFAAQEPRAFDSYVQQFDRTVNGQDKVISTAQYSGYLQFKARGAPIAFVTPPEGLPIAPQTVGIIDHAPHPEAAKLFMDWYFSVPGQKAIVKATALYSPRTDVPPPEGGVPITDFKTLAPTDWNAFLKTHTQFVREWDRMVGMR
jgi:iron(III) transport system substrate-binding protein